VINGLARKDICRLDRCRLVAREREQEIARIAAWARANEGKSEVQLDVAALDEELAAGAGWYTVQPRSLAAGAKQHAVLTTLHSYLLDARRRRRPREIIGLCRK